MDLMREFKDGNKSYWALEPTTVSECGIICELAKEYPNFFELVSERNFDTKATLYLKIRDDKK